MRTNPVVILVVAHVVLATPALAVDGVIEINQTRALAGDGAGDAPGFPVKLTASGSYRLTSNLEVDSLNTTAIEVGAHDVSIDLNGFVIANKTPCRPDCGLPGNGVGVDASGLDNTAVSNGTIVGMGDAAVRVGDDSHVSRLRVIGNGGIGISVGGRATVRDCIVDGAGGIGIRTGVNGGVYESLVRNASGAGVQMGPGSSISGSRVEGSGGKGVEITGKRGSVIGNVILGSASEGVDLDDGVVTDNVIAQSGGPAIFMNAGQGGVIQANQLSENHSAIDVAGSGGTVITGNAIRNSSVIAINGNSSDGYGGNVLSGNGGSPQVAGPAEIGENVCDGNTTCP